MGKRKRGEDGQKRAELCVRKGLNPYKDLKINGKTTRQDNHNQTSMNININITSGSTSGNAAVPQNVNSRAIFIVENASLQKGFVRKKWKILDAEDDADFLRRQGKNLDDYRPDIVYEALRGILDSRVNNAGMIGAVYVKTDTGLLFEIKPHVRIPRHCKRFSGIVLELLQKSCVRAKETGELLMRVLEGPVTRYLPDNAHIIGLSYTSQKLVDIEHYVSAASDDLNLVFVVGAMEHGKISKDYTNDNIALSNYPLDTKSCIGLICEALMRKWKTY